MPETAMIDTTVGTIEVLTEERKRQKPSLKPRVARFEKVSLDEWKKRRNPDEYDEEEWEGFYNDVVSIPRRQTPDAVCYDFVCPYKVVISPHGGRVKIFTGIKCEILYSDITLFLAPRSSASKPEKGAVRLTNTVGITEAGYYNCEQNEGNIFISLINYSDKEVVFEKGERFVQGMFIEVFYTVDDEPGNKARTGGCGSTGKF